MDMDWVWSHDTQWAHGLAEKHRMLRDNVQKMRYDVLNYLVYCVGMSDVYDAVMSVVMLASSHGMRCVVGKRSSRYHWITRSGIWLGNQLDLGLGCCVRCM